MTKRLLGFAAAMMAMLLVLAAPVTHATVHAAPASSDCYEIIQILVADQSIIDCWNGSYSADCAQLAADSANGVSQDTINDDIYHIQLDDSMYNSAVDQLGIDTNTAKDMQCM